MCCEAICAPYDDVDALAQLGRRCQCITFEFENVPSRTLQILSNYGQVYPSIQALSVTQDRLYEKQFLQQQGIPTAPFMPVDDRAALDQAVTELGLPAVLKTRTLGYDGKGQRLLRCADDVEAAWAELGGVPLILEGFVAFDDELSCIAVRDTQGQQVYYPLTLNQHDQGMLQRSTPVAAHPLQQQAQQYAQRILSAFAYVGVLTIEFFRQGDQLIANEIAPRVHNSGHWTLEGACTSQFENHIRAISGLPLGSTELIQPCTLFNLIGQDIDRAAALRLPGVHLHWYGKPIKPGRKVGHITLTSTDNAVEAALVALIQPVYSNLASA